MPTPIKYPGRLAGIVIGAPAGAVPEIYAGLKITASASEPELRTEEAHRGGDSRPWEHYAYTITLHGREEDGSALPPFTVKWKQGTGHAPHAPIALDSVLDSLVRDSDAGALPWEEFAAEYGYDEDSRAQHRIWKACKKMRARLIGWMGSERFAQLVTIAEGWDL